MILSGVLLVGFFPCFQGNSEISKEPKKEVMGWTFKNSKNVSNKISPVGTSESFEQLDEKFRPFYSPKKYCKKIMFWKIYLEFRKCLQIK